MWLESAGAGFRVSSAGKWLAVLTGPELADIGTERRTFAELTWDDRYGDRHTAMTILTYSADATEILETLSGALLTDDELRFPQGWIHYDDPFGDWHEDPCATAAPDPEATPAQRTEGGDR